MKIIKTYGWLRRDFCFDAECEFCGNIEIKITGYDDSNYYDNVIPNMKCEKCGESSISKKSDEIILRQKPRYNENIMM